MRKPGLKPCRVKVRTGPVHYEVYHLKRPGPWALLLAMRTTKHAIDVAEDMLADRRRGGSQGDPRYRRWNSEHTV
jgi:hypothetical protein